MSTHLIQPPGVDALRRWGLLDRVVATGCPAIHTYAFDFGPFTLTGSPGADRSDVAYAPRRTVLDKILLDAASAAGVDRVAGIRGRGRGGATVTERARVVVGADGLHSLVARAVDAERYREKAPLLAAYYSYWSGLPMEGRFEVCNRPHRAFGAWPTNDDLTLVIGGWPYAEFESNKADIEGNFLDVIDLVRRHGRAGIFPQALRARMGAAGAAARGAAEDPGSAHGNREAMDGFARVNAGVTSPAEFFSEDKRPSHLRGRRLMPSKHRSGTPTRSPTRAATSTTHRWFELSAEPKLRRVPRELPRKALRGDRGRQHPPRLVQHREALDRHDIVGAMNRLAVVLIVACVITDMATPLCPGAFRLDPGESIHGVGSRTGTPLPPPQLNAPPVQTHDQAPAGSRYLERLTPSFVSGWLPRHRMLPRSALGSPSQFSSSRTLEDG